jgi:hypothetical protein
VWPRRLNDAFEQRTMLVSEIRSAQHRQEDEMSTNTNSDAKGPRLRIDEAGAGTEGHAKGIRRVQPAGQDDEDTEGHGPGTKR